MCIQNASFEVIRINIFSLGVVSDWWRGCLTDTPGVIGDGTKRRGFERTNASAVRKLHEKKHNFTSLLRFLWTFRLFWFGTTERLHHQNWTRVVRCLMSPAFTKHQNQLAMNLATPSYFLDSWTWIFQVILGPRGSVILKHESFKKRKRIYHFHIADIAVLSTWAPSAKLYPNLKEKGQ